eukprot:12366854-Alexandrium_andersonii.AAC.1
MRSSSSRRALPSCFARSLSARPGFARAAFSAKEQVMATSRLCRLCEAIDLCSVAEDFLLAPPRGRRLREEL